MSSTLFDHPVDVRDGLHLTRTIRAHLIAGRDIAIRSATIVIAIRHVRASHLLPLFPFLSAAAASYIALL
jgi:hypothetical protein